MLEVSPMNGQTLTEALHAHGINVRYIGKVADGTKHLPHLWDLCSNEIVVRSAKHILKVDVLRDIEDHDIAPAISHFFNCSFEVFKLLAQKLLPTICSLEPRKRSPKAWKFKFWLWKAMLLLLAPIQVGFCSRCTSSSGYHIKHGCLSAGFGNWNAMQPKLLFGII